MTVRLIIGTVKGGFIATANNGRTQWELDGPFFKGWKVTASTRDRNGRHLIATASDVYGPAVHVSDDLVNWRQVAKGPAWPKDTERKLNQIWTINAETDKYYLGVDEAGLFDSDDRGESWRQVPGLNEHETRPGWQPGAGGLCLHAILIDPKNPQRIWVGMSAVGVMRSDDGGKSWKPKNTGIPHVLEDKQYKDIGYCVHGLAADPDDANVIYRREHIGVFRSTDGGDHWERIEKGLNSWFGFPIVVDRATKDIYLIPLESDEYRLPLKGNLEVFRSRDGGDSWQSASNGLPERGNFSGVLRGAMDLGHQSPCGVYFGTTSGEVFVSPEAGQSWTKLPATLPRILSVKALVE